MRPGNNESGIDTVIKEMLKTSLPLSFEKSTFILNKMGIMQQNKNFVTSI